MLEGWGALAELCAGRGHWLVVVLPMLHLTVETLTVSREIPLAASLQSLFETRLRSIFSKALVRFLFIGLSP